MKYKTEWLAIMKYKIQPVFIFSLMFILSYTLYSQSIPEDSLYLDQTPPGNKPKVFQLPVDSGLFAAERIAVTNDGKEIYYGEVDNYPPKIAKIKYFLYSNNKWNGPFTLFNNFGAPALSVNNQKLYFANELYCVKNDTGWSTPVKFWSTSKHLHYPQETNAGNYYLSSLPDRGGTGRMDWSKLIIGNTDTTVQSLGLPLNTYNDNLDFYIARDESFIILVSGSKDRKCFGYSDLFISFKKNDNTWTNPKNLGLEININDPYDGRWGPYVTVDNKYLFYSHGKDPSTAGINWVRIDKLIDSLKHTDFAPYASWPIASQTAMKGVLFNFTVPDSAFYDDDDNNTLTYSAALNNGKSLPGWLSFNSATKTFSGIPNKTEIDSIKVTVTDTAGASTSDVFTITVANQAIDYFGQTPPGDSAVVFAPGLVSLTDRLENSLAFSPDGNECFISVWGANYSSAEIYWMKRVGNEWTPQVEAPFSKGHFASRPFFSLDGSRLYFHYANFTGPDPYNIWMVQRTYNGWSEPIHLPSPINSNYRDGSYSETADGTVYFISNRPGGYDNKGDIWRTCKVPGQPLQVENLGNIVNSSAWDGDSFVSPDGSFLIFTSERPGGYGSSDIYITYKKDDGNWTQPVNMERNGNGINIKNTASVGPSISPDGKFLFFSHWAGTPTGETADIYWISTKVIDDIKKEVFNSKITK
jgi:hypothetical protein